MVYPILTVPRPLTIDSADVFDRVNSRGTKLTDLACSYSYNRWMAQPEEL